MIIRLKWWYDGVNALYEGKSGQDSPVLDALAPAIHNKMICREALEHYMTETEKCIRGEAHKNEAMLYSILANMINEKGRKNRFQNVIQSHQAKGDYTALRPLRLWLSYIKRPEQHHS